MFYTYILIKRNELPNWKWNNVADCVILIIIQNVFVYFGAQIFPMREFILTVANKQLYFTFYMPKSATTNRHWWNSGKQAKLIYGHVKLMIQRTFDMNETIFCLNSDTLTQAHTHVNILY